MEATAFILTGGKSTRMGADKAFLQIEKQSLLNRLLQTAISAGMNSRIVGPHEKYAGYGATVEDVFPCCGPLGGIHAALASSQTELNLMLAVDMPFLLPEFLRWLVGCAQQTSALVTVPHVDGRFQPLCAVYRRGFRQLAEDALRAGQNRVDRLFSPEITCVVTEEELTRLSFPASMFDNLNTRDEFARAASGRHDVR